MTSRLRRWAVVIGLVWLPVVVLWGPLPFSLTFDDAYYYFEIGRNLADGLGSTFDGSDPTNGYHPLWMAIVTLAYLVGFDDLGAVRALLTLQLGMWVATLWLLSGHVGAAVDEHRRLHTHPDGARAARLSDGAVLATFVLLGADPFVLKLFVNGLESGVTAVAYTVLLVRVAATGGAVITSTDRRWRILTGLVLAWAFLGRTDAVIVVAVLGLWALIDAWPLRGRAVPRLIELFGPPTVAVAAFLTWNLAAFGEPTQVSGDIKRLPLTAGRVAVVAVAVAAAVLIIVSARRVSAEPRLPRTRKFLGSTAWFGSASVLLVAYYTTLQAVPYLWYFAPVALYGTWLLLLLAADFTEGAVLEAPERPPVRAIVPVAVILLLPLIVGAAWQSNSFVDPQIRSIQEANREAGVWISANLPDDAVLGSFDAGVIGYFTEQRLINLDGVVNSFEYLEAGDEGTTDVFLRSRGITHLVNHGQDVDGDDPDTRRLASALLGDGTGERLTLVRRWEFEFAGNTDGARFTGGVKQMAVFLYEVPPAQTP